MTNKFSILKNFRIIIPVVSVVFLLSILMPRNGEFEYRYHRGVIWNYETLVAQFNFPILKTREQLDAEREKIGSSYIPYYEYMEEPMSDINSYVALMQGDKDYAVFADEFRKVVKPLYERGILPEDNVGADGLDRTMSEDVLYIQRGKRASKVARSEVYSTSQAAKIVRMGLKERFPGTNVDSLLATSGLSAMIRPNLSYDKHTTSMVRQRQADNISPTCGIFKSGSVIVSQGELITADIEQILDSYKAEYQSTVGYNGPNYLLWLGNLLACITMVFLLLSLIFFSRPEIFDSPGQFYFILTVFVISNIITFIFGKYEDPQIFYLLPYPVLALYLMAFFRKRLVLPLYTICLLPLLFTGDDGGKLFFMFLFAGFIAVFSFTYFYKGWRQFISAFFIFIAMMLAGYSFALVMDGPSTMAYKDILYIFLGSLFAILAYPLIYLFEVIFNLVSAAKLSDLADTSNPLLRELSDKAPGTFQHSLSVMNMAEAVGRAVDADVYLLRVGALYHDIGKLADPRIFTENNMADEAGEARLSLKERAAGIIRHVADGGEIASKHNLPKLVRDFIHTHHGTTSTGYFYTKYLNEGGDPDDVAEFFYPGPKPSTKEQVILMLCDSVEAASRSLRVFNAQSVSKLVDDIYADKFKSGQYDDSDITLHELEQVKQTLKTYIMQVHHGRVAYPRRNS